MQQTKIGETILFVGRSGEILSRLQNGFPNKTVTATADRLSGLTTTSAEHVKRHRLVLFETDGNSEDIAALKRLSNGLDELPTFVALIDDGLAIGSAGKLFEAGAEVLPESIARSALAKSLAQYMAGPRQPEPAPAPVAQAGAVYSIVPSRGGGGATTVAVNLAVSLAASLPHGGQTEAGQNRVLLLDLDIQFGNAGTYVDVEDNGALVDLLAGNADPTADRVLAAVQKTEHGIDIITAPTMFVPVTAMTPELAERMLDVLRAHYDHVVIDLPRAALDWVEPLIKGSDRLVLVSDGSVPCIRQAKRLVDLFREMDVDLKIALEGLSFRFLL